MLEQCTIVYTCVLANWYGNVYPVKVVVASLAGKSWGWYQGWIPISHRVLGCGLWVGDGYPIEKEKNTPLCKLYELRDFKMLCAFPE